MRNEAMHVRLRIGVAVCGALLWASGAWAQPLLDYVNAPDASYQWSIEEQAVQPNGSTLVKLAMTSQTWQGIAWTHHLWMMLPKDLSEADNALLVVTGGNPEAQFTMLGAAICEQAKTVCAVLWNIPNQPLFEGRSEDALIAYTFVRYLETKDPSWPLLFPMTKAAVRAMDTVQACCAQLGHSVDGFIVAGASKRGWTTWMTACADPRVVGIAPMVYDNLNLPAQMANQRRVYAGGYSEQISEYTEYSLQDMLSSEQGRGLGEMVDPYSFRESLTMPKLVINGSNDPYWTLESANLYLPDLKGEKSLHYSPNAGHDLGGAQPALTRIVPTVVAFIRHCGGYAAWPKLRWQYERTPGGLCLSLRPGMPPAKVGVWVTETTTDTRPSSFTSPGALAEWVAESGAQDFRKCKWTYVPLEATDGLYRYTLPPAEMGYAAMFAEVQYQVEGRPVYLSTAPGVAR